MSRDTYYYPHPDISNCVEVLVPDTRLDELNTTPHKVEQWCKENTKSFVWMDEVDTTDHSPIYDYVYAFYFVNEADANWFTLRWI